MSKSNNEIPALVTSLLVTVVICGGAYWLLKDNVSFLGSGRDSTAEEETAPLAGGQPGSATGDPARLAAIENVPAGRFLYGGSTTWAPIRGVLTPVVEAALPTFELRYTEDASAAAGSSSGIQMLIAGELDFAQSSWSLTEAEKQQAAQQGVNLEAIPVALEAVAIATHPDLPISGLTLTQLKDIYTGTATNWNQVGGPALPIVPVSRGLQGGTVQFFQESVLQGGSFLPSLQTLDSTTAALRFVGQTPGAIYFASAPEVVGQCSVAPLPVGTSPRDLVAPYQTPYVPPEDCPAQRNQIDLGVFQRQDYPMTRPLYVVVRRDGGVSEQAGLAYTEIFKTDIGKQLLNQAGFVAVE